MKALIVVDVQNDFCPGGALPVPGGDEVVPIINKLMSQFDKVVMTQDWHPKDHCSFAENGGEWPIHCVMNTAGAQLHIQLHTEADTCHILKGVKPNTESYSGFDNPGLGQYLHAHKVDSVYVCGLAMDYCVKATAIDAAGLGFDTYVITDACRGVNVHEDDTRLAVISMEAAGVHMVGIIGVNC